MRTAIRVEDDGLPRLPRLLPFFAAPRAGTVAGNGLRPGAARAMELRQHVSGASSMLFVLSVLVGWACSWRLGGRGLIVNHAGLFAMLEPRLASARAATCAAAAVQATALGIAAWPAVMAILIATAIEAELPAGRRSLVALPALTAYVLGTAAVVRCANGWAHNAASRLLRGAGCLLGAVFLLNMIVTEPSFVVVGTIFVTLSNVALFGLIFDAYDHGRARDHRWQLWKLVNAEGVTLLEKAPHEDDGTCAARAAAGCLRWQGVARRPLVRYLASVLPLALNAGFVAGTAAEKRGLGIALLAAALVVDAVLLVLHTVAPFQDPWNVVAPLFALRCLLVFVGSNYWFLGHCAAAAALSAVAMHRISRVGARDAREGRRSPEADVIRDAAGLPEGTPLARTLARGGDGLAKLLRLPSTCRTLAFLVGALWTPLLVEAVLIGAVGGDHLHAAPIAAGRSQGWAAPLFLLMCVFVGSATVVASGHQRHARLLAVAREGSAASGAARERLVDLARSWWTRCAQVGRLPHVPVAPLAAMVASELVGSVLLSVVFGNWAWLLFGLLWLPGILLIATGWYFWKANGLRLMVPGGGAAAAGAGSVDVEEPHGAKDDADLEDVDLSSPKKGTAASEEPGIPPRCRALAAALMEARSSAAACAAQQPVLCCWAAAVLFLFVLAYGGAGYLAASGHAHTWLPPSVSLVTLLAATSCVLISAWIYHGSMGEATFLCAAAVKVGSVVAWTAALATTGSSMTGALLSAGAGVIALDVAAAALFLLADNGWRVEEGEGGRLFYALCAAGVLLATVMSISFFFTLSTLAGATALALTAVATSGSVLVYRWSRNGFRLPRGESVAANLVWAISIVSAAAAGAAVSSDRLELLFLSLAWFTLCAYVLSCAARSELDPRRIRERIFCRGGFPVLCLADQSGGSAGEVVQCNRGPLAVCGSLLLLACWGIWAAVLAKPAAAGSVVAAVALNLAYLYGKYVSAADAWLASGLAVLCAKGPEDTVAAALDLRRTAGAGAAPTRPLLGAAEDGVGHCTPSMAAAAIGYVAATAREVLPALESYAEVTKDDPLMRTVQSEGVDLDRVVEGDSHVGTPVEQQLLERARAIAASVRPLALLGEKREEAAVKAEEALCEARDGMRRWCRTGSLTGAGCAAAGADGEQPQISDSGGAAGSAKDDGNRRAEDSGIFGGLLRAAVAVACAKELNDACRHAPASIMLRALHAAHATAQAELQSFKMFLSTRVPSAEGRLSTASTIQKEEWLAAYCKSIDERARAAAEEERLKREDEEATRRRRAEGRKRGSAPGKEKPVEAAKVKRGEVTRKTGVESMRKKTDKKSIKHADEPGGLRGPRAARKRPSGAAKGDTSVDSELWPAEGILLEEEGGPKLSEEQLRELEDIRAQAAALRAAGKSYVDDAFPMGADALGQKVLSRLKSAPRYVSHCGEFPGVGEHVSSGNGGGLPVRGVDPDHVAQGRIGDCYYMSALSVLATRPEIMSRNFVFAQPDVGLYAIALHVGGGWQLVVVDDRFAAYPAGVTRKGSIYIFGHTRKVRQAAYVQVLEKAYAKVHGSYASIVGGFVSHALAELTGGVADRILEFNKCEERIASGELWRHVKSAIADGHLLGAGSPAGKDTDATDLGVVLGHAYSILDARDVPGGHQLVKLRNPWGSFEWKGDWSDKSNRWTPRLRRLLDAVDKNDGTFWMSFQDFTTYFRRLYVCRLHEGSRFRHWVFQGCWSTADDTAGGGPSRRSVGKNPQFFLRAARPCTVDVELRQASYRTMSTSRRQELGVDEESEVEKIACGLFQSGGRRVREKKDCARRIGTLNFTKKLTWSNTYELPCTDGPVTLVPFTLRAGVSNDFELRVFTSADVGLVIERAR